MCFCICNILNHDVLFFFLLIMRVFKKKHPQFATNIYMQDTL